MPMVSVELTALGWSRRAVNSPMISSRPLPAPLEPEEVDSLPFIPLWSVSGSVGGGGVGSRGGVGRAYGRWIEWMHGCFDGWADGCMGGMDGSMMLIAVLNLPLEDKRVVRIIRGPMNLHPKLRHNLR